MRNALVSIGLMALVLGVYAGVRQHDFVVFDDPLYVSRNPALVGGPSAENLHRAFTRGHAGSWSPLTLVSLQLDWSLYAFDAPGYKRTNVLLHAASTVLLFFALMQATGARGRSAFVAAVFAAHPLHVESVAWVAERKDVLSGFFWMATLLAYVHWAGSRSPLVYVTLLVAFACALLSKPMAVTLPFVLLLLDLWPLRRLRADGALGWPERRAVGRAVAEKLPLLALVGPVAWITYRLQQAEGAMAHDAGMSLMARLANAAIAYAAYLRDSFWPSGLAAFYPHQEGAVSLPVAALCAVGLAALTLLALRAVPRRPWLAVGWLWYLGALVPVIGLVQVGLQARADRYTYLPQIGLLIALAWGAVDLAGVSPARRRALAVAAVAGVAALSLTAQRQVDSWRDSEALFARAVAVTRDNYLAHHGLGNQLLDRGEVDAAGVHLREVVRIDPGWAPGQFSLARLALAQRDPRRAIRHAERGLRIWPYDPRGHRMLALALLGAGEHSEALGRARFAVRLGGLQRPESLLALGRVLAARGEPGAARAAHDEALALAPDLAGSEEAETLAHEIREAGG